MLHDLGFLQVGQLFPPLAECERIADYRDNLKLFEGNYYNLNKQYYKDMLKCVQHDIEYNGVVQKIQKLIDNNYYQLTSIKTRDLVCGDNVEIALNEQGDWLNELLHDVKLHHKLDVLVIDISRYGDACALCYLTQDNKVNISVQSPEVLYKIVDINDKDNVLYYVIACVNETEISEYKKRYTLNVQIHENGKYTSQEYLLSEPANATLNLRNGKSDGRIINIDRYKIISKLSEQTYVTGLTNNAVISMHHLITSSDCYGKSDYDKFDSIICEITERLSEISIILHKHAEPSIYAPRSAFRQNTITGQWFLKVGNAFLLDENSTPPAYLTWDGQLSAAFAELDILFKQLYTLSEMGAVFSASESDSQIAYETMKAKFINAEAKARRIQRCMEEPIKHIIQNLSELDGKKVDCKDININWNDCLPRNEQQEIQNATAKIQIGLSTAKLENIHRFGMTEQQAEEVAEQVAEEESRKASMNSLNPFAEFNDNAETDDTNEEDSNNKKEKDKTKDNSQENKGGSNK